MTVTLARHAPDSRSRPQRQAGDGASRDHSASARRRRPCRGSVRRARRFPPGPGATASFNTPSPFSALAQPFGEARKHGNHLRLIEHAMTTGLPQAVTSAVDLGYSPITSTDENEFVVPGPGALDGISKCFASTGGLTPAETITWMRDTSPDHFARLGLRFEDLWGPLADADRPAERVLRGVEVHPAIPPARARRVGADQDQAAVPAAGRGDCRIGMPAS